MAEENWNLKYILRLVLNIVLPLSGWLLLCLLGPKLLKFFLPFVIGWILAAIANPPVRFLERRLKLVRRHSSILVVIAVLAAVVGILYLLIAKTIDLGSGLVKAMPQILESLQLQIRQRDVYKRQSVCGRVFDYSRCLFAEFDFLCGSFLRLSSSGWKCSGRPFGRMAAELIVLPFAVRGNSGCGAADRTTVSRPFGCGRAVFLSACAGAGIGILL